MKAKTIKSGTAIMMMIWAGVMVGQPNAGSVTSSSLGTAVGEFTGSLTQISH